MVDADSKTFFLIFRLNLENFRCKYIQFSKCEFAIRFRNSNLFLFSFELELN